LPLVGSRKTISPLGLRYKRHMKDMLEVCDRSRSRRDSYYSFGILRKYCDSRSTGYKVVIEGLIEKGCTVIVIGDRHEAISWRSLASHLYGESRQNAKDALLYRKTYILTYRLDSRTSCSLVLGFNAGFYKVEEE
jgi:hypothetical protein